MLTPFKNKHPQVHESCFIAPSADLIGDIEIGESSSVWFQVVIRGDVLPVKIGRRTNIQDHSLLHATPGAAPTIVGDDVTVGHRTTLHGCTIGDRVLVGMGAIILDGAEIGEECIIGAGTLITKGTKIPPRSLVMGAPGKIIRSLKPEEIAMLLKSSAGYVENAGHYR